MERAYDPIHLTCDSCGAPIRYEIGSGTYKCAHCGNTTAPGDRYKKIQDWKKLRQSELRKEISDKTLLYHCPGCGADVLVGHKEAIGTCRFCGGSLVRRDYLDTDSFPELVVPFSLDDSQAKERLESFACKHLRGRKKKTVLESVNDLEGCYLPYQFVRGPIDCDIYRDVSSRTYHAFGYIEDLAVNTNKQLSNEVLDCIEPYDWDQTREFSFGYVAGHRVKIQDANDKEVTSRVYREIEKDFLPVAEKTLQTKGVEVNATASDLEQLPVILPVYFTRDPGYCAAVNGQNGNVALTFFKEKDRSKYWYIEPLLTMAAFGILTFVLSRSLELTFYVAAAVGLIAFTAFSNNRMSHEQMIVYSDHDSRKERLKTAVRPLFHEKIDGKEEIVEIRFTPFSRIAGLIIRALLFNALPLLIAAFLKWSSNEPLSSICLTYISIWLVISVPFTFIFYIAYARRDIYDHPYMYRTLADGSRKRIRNRPQIGAMISTAFEFVKDSGFGFGLLLFGLPLLMFIMSIYLMMTG